MDADTCSKASLKHYISGKYFTGESQSILAETPQLQSTAKSFSGSGEKKPKHKQHAAILPALGSSAFLLEESFVVNNLRAHTHIVLPMLNFFVAVDGVLSEGDVRAFFWQIN